MTIDDTPAIELTGLTKRFGALTAVDDLSLRVRPGETVALLGPNGAGKSTTINVLLGLLDADAGRVRVLGAAPRRAVVRGAVGAMLQNTGMPADVYVRELVDLARALYPNPLPRGRLVEEAGLADIFGKRVEQLSGGQRQRVKLAMALAGNPEVLVLDEPTVAMDVETRRAFWERIHAAARAGRTVLFATHYLAEAEEYADRVVVIARGSLVADGTAASLTSRVSGRTIRFTVTGGTTGTGVARTGTTGAAGTGPDGYRAAGAGATGYGATGDGITGDGVATVGNGVGDAAWYAALPGVTQADTRGATVVLVTGDPESTLRALLATHDRLPDLTVTGASLEDAFVALTADTADTAGIGHPQPAGR